MIHSLCDSDILVEACQPSAASLPLTGACRKTSSLLVYPANNSIGYSNMTIIIYKIQFLIDHNLSLEGAMMEIQSAF